MNTQVATGQVFAVVVGIEKYAEGADWDVPGPATAARAFTKFLRDRGVPAENVRLFLDPIDGNMTAVDGVRPNPTTRDAVEETFATDLPGQAGELLYVYWSGHGVLAPDGRRRLFYPNARAKNLRNLDLADLLLKLRCEEYGEFSRQVVLVDACASIVAHGGLPASIPSEQWSKGDVFAGRQQYALCAASEGEFALAHSDHRGGLSLEVLDVLGSTADVFPPDMDAVFAALNARFDELRRAGDTLQMPTCIVHRGWCGAEEEFSPRAPRPSLEAAVAAYKRAIDAAWRGGTDERGQPLLDKDGRRLGKWVETPTHEDFRDEP